MNTKHTPGPWTYNGKARAVYAGPLSVANCTRNAVGITDTDQSDANCRLIAAAPDLLAALRSTQELLDTVANWLSGDEGYFDPDELDATARQLAGEAMTARAAIAKATSATA